jgi:hypothetical protein
MVYRIHRNASDPRSPAQPPIPPGLAQIDILMGRIAQLPDSCFAVYQNHANLAGRQLNQGIAIFLCHQLSIGAGTSHNLSAFSRS